MASFDRPDIARTSVSPALLVGVASPLWSYFGAAAAGGMAYWWMTRWARPVNLEAQLALPAAALPPPIPAALPAIEAETAVEPAPEASAALTAVTPEPVIDEPAPVALAPVEPAPRGHAKKAPAAETDT